MTAVPSPLRADAVRNARVILATAEEVFREKGVDAPLDEIPRRVGVSRATLYRHFPSREHLFAAILKSKVEALVMAGQTRIDYADRWQAVQEWLDEYEGIGAEFRGMSARVGAAILDDRSPVGELCRPMKDAFAELFLRAQDADEVRRDVTSADVLEIIAALPRDETTGRANPMHLRVVMEGLRSKALAGLRG